MSTKKLLVAFNPEKPNANSSDFLVPVKVDGRYVFQGVSSGKFFEYGVVILTGMPVTMNDIFSKLIDLGVRIESVDNTVCLINYYFELLKGVKITNIIKIAQNVNEEDFSFEVLDRGNLVDLDIYGHSL